VNYAALVERLVARRVLRTPAIVRAFREVRREHFLSDDVVEWAGEDHPLPIGHGQTNSQPYTVAFMFELLQPEAGQNVLDVGCGSGWTTALLAEIVGAGGSVIGTERISELAQYAEIRIESLGIENTSIMHTPTVLGRPAKAPFDRILVSAAAQEVPSQLVDQLAVGGIMVIPVRHSIFKIEKTSQGTRREEHPGFSFVPLID
jgi:protein-L-isoaspartate(D-aspartate) O-methyltransferase